MNMRLERWQLHPAAEWAVAAAFSPMEVDCTTAVVLKIMDDKCKMLPGEKVAVQAVYDIVRYLPASLFGKEVHRVIDQARRVSVDAVADQIHHLRVDAEARIPKPVMKAYKAKLRDGLFG